MGLLDTNQLQKAFGSAFKSIYGSGQLIRITMQRQPEGTIVPTEQSPVPIKVQVDQMTEAMRRQEGASDRDVRILVLQDGLTGPALTSDDVVIAQGVRWKLFGLTQDPARAYYEARGVRDAAT